MYVSEQKGFIAHATSPKGKAFKIQNESQNMNSDPCLLQLQQTTGFSCTPVYCQELSPVQGSVQWAQVQKGQGRQTEEPAQVDTAAI